MRIRIRQRLPGTSETLRDREIHPLRLSLCIAEGLLVILGLDFADDFLALAAEPEPTITARVLNYTEATPATMAKAEYQANRILGEAGLHVIWLDCPLGQSAGVITDPCQQPLKPTEIVLRVLSDHRRNGVQDDAFGFAVLPVLASVYYEHAVYLARSEGAEFEVSTILGCVMAHEIGHLLLGSNSHSGTGIMQGQWERKQVSQIMKGFLRFTPQQSKLIRAEGQIRMMLESRLAASRSEASLALSASMLPTAGELGFDCAHLLSAPNQVPIYRRSGD